MDELKLKRCPFCEGEATFIDNGEEDHFEDWGVVCGKCGIFMVPPGEEPGAVTTREEAAKAWNRRPDET